MSLNKALALIVVGMFAFTGIGSVALISVAPAEAGVIDSIMNSGKEEIQSTDAYEMDVYGFDARIYEWTPKHNKNISCVFVASNKSSGVACYEKAQ